MITRNLARVRREWVQDGGVAGQEARQNEAVHLGQVVFGIVARTETVLAGEPEVTGTRGVAKVPSGRGRVVRAH